MLRRRPRSSSCSLSVMISPTSPQSMKSVRGRDTCPRSAACGPPARAAPPSCGSAGLGKVLRVDPVHACESRSMSSRYTLVATTLDSSNPASSSPSSRFRIVCRTCASMVPTQMPCSAVPSAARRERPLGRTIVRVVGKHAGAGRRARAHVLRPDGDAASTDRRWPRR